MSLATPGAQRRPPAVSGLFYRDDADALRREVRAYVDGGSRCSLVPRAVIVPHAGYVYSGAVAGSGYRALANVDRPIRRVYLLGPAHRVYTRGVASPSHRAFQTPLGDVPVDQPVIAELAARHDFIAVSDASHEQEHSLEVHLPFLQTVLEEFTLVPLVVGDIDPVRLEALIDDMLDDEAGLVVVSSDLSHYHSYEDARAIDARTVEHMERLEWREMRPERACGCLPVSALLLCAAARGYAVSAVDVRNSGDTAGPKDRVVGYASLVVHDRDARLDRPTRQRLLKVARNAIDHAIDERSFAVDRAGWPSHCLAPAATFVTLSIDGRLRGCVGSLEAEEPLVHNVAGNAVRAALFDPRFTPLSRHEFAQTALSISVLTPATPVRFDSQEDLLSRIRPGVDGLILSCGERCGTFLPSVWESLRTPEAFVAGLKRKASLPEGYWSDEIRVQRFTTEYFGDT